MWWSVICVNSRLFFAPLLPIPQKEFTKVAKLTGIGFLAVGLIGFVVKVIFIPINQVRGSGGSNSSPTLHPEGVWEG